MNARRETRLDGGASGEHSRLGKVERLIGRYDSGIPGPTLLVVGGVHGNEPAGVLAARRVFASLEMNRPRLAGRFVAFAGNLAALQRHERYVQSDLNRMWSAERIARLLADDAAGDGFEQAEQRDLLRHMEHDIVEARGPVAFLDLHSTSAKGPPFSIMSDTLQNRRVALKLPIPVILGLEETIEATLMEYLGERGHLAVGVEGGQHDDPETIDNHESVLWMTLVSLGLLDADSMPEYGVHRRRLGHAGRGLPSVVEILHRHPIDPDDGFHMVEGYVNFTPVRKGQLLAADRRGELRAHRDSLLLLPSYQGLGDDGYFLGRRVRRSWLRLSAALRRLGADRLLPLLPGVRRDPARPGVLLAHPRVVRFLVVPIFHLFGFRRRRREGGLLVFSRRPEGRWP